MTEAELPFVSIILPIRNERHHIGSCLDSILSGSYPAQRLEVLIVDGCSDDRTSDIVSDYCGRHDNLRLLTNPARVVPHAMNIGIRASRGEIIVRMDAHAQYEPDYIEQLVSWLVRLDADNVGGIVRTQPASGAPQARAVAVILSHPFGVGNSLFRTESAGPPVEADTVPFGCYRREVFERIGLYDELFVRNQDDELNARLKKAGGRIFLVPRIRIEYMARESLSKLSVMFYQYGYFKPLVAIKLGVPATLRQLAPPAFALAVLGLPLLYPLTPVAGIAWCAVLAAHTAVNVIVSSRQALRYGWSVGPPLLAGFLLAHLSYGVGYLRGILDFGILRRHTRRTVTDMPLSR